MSPLSKHLQPSVFGSSFFLPPVEECAHLMNERVQLLLTQGIPKNISWETEEEEYRPQIEQFQKLMAGFCEDYRRVLSSHYYLDKDQVDATHLNDLILLQENHRDHIYAAGHQQGWKLYYNEDPDFSNSDHNLMMRQWMASRIYWVQVRRFHDLDPYPAEERYAGYFYSMSYIKRMLSETKANWVLYSTTLLGLEIRTLMTEVVEIGFAFIRMMRHIRQFECLDHDSSIDRVSVPWTKAIMGSTDDTDEHDKSCFICTYAYGLKYNHEKATEPAVKVSCGHVFGKMCLARWIKDNDTCPYCRHRLCSFVEHLSKGARTIYHKIVGLRQARMQLDEPIDGYFLEEPKTCYGDPMRELLLALRKIRCDTFAVERRLTQLKV